MADEPKRGLRTGGLRTGGLQTGSLEISGLDRVTGDSDDSVLTRPMTSPEVRDFTDPQGQSFQFDPPILDGPDLIDSPDLDVSHPFKITLSDADEWSIETEGSSITNDDDLTAIAIAGLSTARTGVGYVYIQCVISSGVPDGTATVAVSATVLDEVVRTGTDQTTANLFIGEVRQSADPDDDTLEISQSYRTAALLSRSFDSAELVWTFIAYPSHPDTLTAGA